MPKSIKKKKRILMYGDTPTCSSGFGRVMNHIARTLYNTGEFEIDILGINYYDGFYDQKKYPYRILSTKPPFSNDIYFPQNIVAALEGKHLHFKGPYDYLFTIQDIFIFVGIAKEIEKALGDTEWISYWAVDSDLSPQEIDTALIPNKTVVYTDYARNRFGFHNKDKIEVIGHGVDTKDFYPINNKRKIKEFRKKYLHLDDDNTFIISNINRFQPRKNVADTIKAYAKFKQYVPNSRLYLHMKQKDSGGDLARLAFNHGIANDDIILPSNNLDLNKGVPVDKLNLIYNASDIVITTAFGEGWGLTTTEAMATKTPVFAPRHTSFLTTLSENRGILYNTNGNTVIGPVDFNRLRDKPDIDDLVSKMLEYYKDPSKFKDKTENAYKWTQENTWEKVNNKWLELFN